jgi:hypothetical protein
MLELSPPAPSFCPSCLSLHYEVQLYSVSPQSYGPLNVGAKATVNALFAGSFTLRLGDTRESQADLLKLTKIFTPL